MVDSFDGTVWRTLEEIVSCGERLSMMLKPGLSMRLKRPSGARAQRRRAKHSDLHVALGRTDLCGRPHL